jgi:hypothetical protein
MPNLPTSAAIIACRTERNQNSGGANTTLITVRLPPGLLRNIGDCVKITAGFFMAANANSKTNNVLWGSTSIVGRTASENGLPRLDICYVYKRGANQQGAIATDHDNGQASLVIFTDTLTEDEQSPILVSMTAQGVSTGDVESRLLLVEYVPAFSNFGMI